MDILNTSHTSKKFYYEISDKEVNFLVTTVYITSENKLNTKIHIKPTDRQSYLHKNSRTSSYSEEKHPISHMDKHYVLKEFAMRNSILCKYQYLETRILKTWIPRNGYSKRYRQS